MRCEMCGTDDDDLEAVHRVYLGAGREPERVEEVEEWCPSCRSQYPNDAA